MENTKKALDEGKSRLKLFLKKQAERVKNAQVTCPLCREVVKGISELGSHLKKHCTS